MTEASRLPSPLDTPAERKLPDGLRDAPTSLYGSAHVSRYTIRLDTCQVWRVLPSSAASGKLRYVSERNEESVADRIRAVRESLPPKEGRQSRKGHVSQEDFAPLVGVSRGRIIAWEGGDAYPEPENAERLAELSGGLYTSADFTRSEDRRLLNHKVGEILQLLMETRALLVEARDEARVERQSIDSRLEEAAELAARGFEALGVAPEQLRPPEDEQGRRGESR